MTSIQEQFELHIPVTHHSIILDMLMNTLEFLQLFDIIDQHELEKYKTVRLIVQRNTIPDSNNKKIIFIIEDY